MNTEENRKFTMEDYSKGKQCNCIRKLLGLKQTEFGALVGVSGNAVSDWENENYEPSDTHWKIIKALPDLQRDSKEELQLAFLDILPLCPACRKVVDDFIRKFFKSLRKKLVRNIND